MAERTVSVRLTAEVAGYIAGMKAAQKETAGLAATAQASAAKQSAAWKSVGNAAGIIALGTGAVAAGAVAMAARFDQAMSNVQAATHESAGNMDRLRQAALDAGERTVFSATESAAAIENLAKAGVSTNDILRGGLNGALNLAAAGGIEVGEAAEYAASAMTQFELNGRDVPHIADLLAAAAGKAQGDVGDLGFALKQSGLVASQMGISIEEATGTLGAFASAGLIGSDAGTSFRTMLLRLANPTDESAALMQELGINAYDAQGNFRGLRELAGELQVAFRGQSQETRNAAMATIFGSDAIRAANVLYRNGEAGITRWTRKVNDSGYAAETAATRMDNLAGDFERLMGSLETALIGTGEGAQGPLRDLVQNLDGLLSGFNDLPPEVKSTAFETLALTTAVGGLAFVGSRALTWVMDMKANVATLGGSSASTASKLRGLGVAAAGLVIAIPIIDQLAASMTKEVSVDEWTTALERMNRNFGPAQAVTQAFGGSLDRLDQSLAESTGFTKDFVTGIGRINPILGAGIDLVDPFAANMRGLDEALTAMVDGGNIDKAGKAFDFVARRAKAQGMAVSELLTLLPNYSAALGATVKPGVLSDFGNLIGETIQLRLSQHQGAEVASQTAKVQRMLGGAIHRTGRQAEDTGREVDTLRYAMLRLNNQALTGIESELAFEGALRNAASAARRAEDGLSKYTDSGEANYRTLLDIIRATANRTAELKKQGAAEREMREAIDKGRKAFLNSADAMNVAEDRARTLWQRWTEVEKQADQARGATNDFGDAAKGLPGGHDFTVHAHTTEAQRELQSFVQDANARMNAINDETVDIHISSQADKVFNQLQRAAYGGPIFGGVPGKDSVPVLAMPGEHIATTAEVQAAGAGSTTRGHRVWEAIRRMALRGELTRYGDLQPFANGGPVLNVPTSGLPSAIQDVRAGLSAYSQYLSGLVSDYISDLLTALPTAGSLGPGGRLTPAQLARGQNFAHSQAGDPYVWGGVGPNGYDCSGFVGAVLNAAVGVNPHQRRGTTSTMPWAGFSPGTGSFTAGWFTGDPGHMAGNIAGLGIESAGSVGVRLGRAATSVTSFPGIAHYDNAPILPPGWTLAYNGTGRDEYVIRMATGGPVKGGGGGGGGGQGPVGAYGGGDGAAHPNPINLAWLLDQLAKMPPAPARLLEQYNKALKEQRRETDQAERAERRLQTIRRQARRDHKVTADEEKKIAEAEREHAKAAREAEKATERTKQALDRYRQAQQNVAARAAGVAEGARATGAVFGGTFTTAGAVSDRLRQAIADVKDATTVIQRLRSRGVTGWLLAQFIEEAQTDPRAVILLGRELLGDADKLRQLIRQGDRFERVTDQLGAVATVPRRPHRGRANPGRIAAGSHAAEPGSRTVNINLNTQDREGIVTEVVRRLRHEERVGGTY